MTSLSTIRHALVTSLCAVAIACTAVSQTVTQYGTACGATGGPPPRLYYTGALPVIGGNFILTYTGPNGGVAGVYDEHPHLLLGFAQTNVAIPASISFFAGCTLLVQPVVTLPMPVSGSGYASQYTLAVPNDPTVTGLTLNAQMVVLYQRFISPQTVGLRFTNGLAITP